MITDKGDQSQNTIQRWRVGSQETLEKGEQKRPIPNYTAHIEVDEPPAKQKTLFFTGSVCKVFLIGYTGPYEPIQTSYGSSSYGPVPGDLSQGRGGKK